MWKKGSLCNVVTIMIDSSHAIMFTNQLIHFGMVWSIKYPTKFDTPLNKETLTWREEIYWINIRRPTVDVIH